MKSESILVSENLHLRKKVTRGVLRNDLTSQLILHVLYSSVNKDTFDEFMSLKTSVFLLVFLYSVDLRSLNFFT